jgi:hypothetical protein
MHLISAGSILKKIFSRQLPTFFIEQTSKSLYFLLYLLVLGWDRHFCFVFCHIHRKATDKVWKYIINIKKLNKIFFCLQNTVTENAQQFLEILSLENVPNTSHGIKANYINTRPLDYNSRFTCSLCISRTLFTSNPYVRTSKSTYPNSSYISLIIDT